MFLRPMRAYWTRTRERIIMSCVVTIHVPIYRYIPLLLLLFILTRNLWLFRPCRYRYRVYLRVRSVVGSHIWLNIIIESTIDKLFVYTNNNNIKFYNLIICAVFIPWHVFSVVKLPPAKLFLISLAKALVDSNTTVIIIITTWISYTSSELKRFEQNKRNNDNIDFSWRRVLHGGHPWAVSLCTCC